MLWKENISNLTLYCVLKGYVQQIIHIEILKNVNIILYLLHDLNGVFFSFVNHFLEDCFKIFEWKYFFFSNQKRNIRSIIHLDKEIVFVDAIFHCLFLQLFDAML